MQVCHEAQHAVEHIYCTTGSGAVNEQVRKTNKHSSTFAKNTLLGSRPVSRALFFVTLIAFLNQSDFPVSPDRSLQSDRREKRSVVRPRGVQVNLKVLKGTEQNARLCA